MSDYNEQRVKDRLDDHEESLVAHDRRISKNENYRLQVQGAMKVLAIILGTGIVGVMLELIGVI